MSETLLAERLAKAEKRISAQPYDTEAWSQLIRDAQHRKMDQARAIYERLVTQFPNAGRYWKIYIEQEMKCRNFENVEKLFQRCLMKVLNIELWKLYLSYIRDTKSSLNSFREKMAQAYGFALDKIGMDIMSYSIWSDYITFLKGVEAGGSYAENQKIAAVRKIYQRGVVNPMINIEIFWKEYCIFENGINPLIGKKMQEDRGRDYSNAKRVAKEYEAYTKGLNRNLPSVPPQNTPEEAKQVVLWKKYINWEKSNPLRTEDQAIITKRVMFAYEQCLLCLGYHPDVWIEAALYLETSSKLLTEKGDQNAGKLLADDAASMYERATTTLLSNNMLIYFAYSDFEESRMKFEKVHSIYKRLIACEDVSDKTLPYIQYMNFARRAEGIKSARNIFKLGREEEKCNFHIYTAAALMEYFCSKDKKVAFRIFELGLKKYSNEAEYILAYFDFMSHLNEDNNTRVLFERVLSSGQLSTDGSRLVWNKFLEFETNVGDLASIMKVEKRRATVMSQDSDTSETALLVDRYRYLDLYPCSTTELKSVGYKLDVGKAVQVVAPTSVDPVITEPVQVRMKPKYPMPDTAQMIPFKAKSIVPIGNHPVAGGIFPPPPAASELLLKLPPPTCFNGPFVLMDKFLEHMIAMQLQDLPKYENGLDPANMDAGTKYSLEVSLTGRKRKVEGMDSDDEGDSLAPPVNDIYRSRQQKKAFKF